jgi:hypothetical protein
VQSATIPKRAGTLDALVPQGARRYNSFRNANCLGTSMTALSRLALTGLFCLSLAACATQPVDTAPPPAKRLDAKTTLEGRR